MGRRTRISMKIGIINTHSGPRCFQTKPPIMGAGIVIRPVHRPIIPLHLPINCFGTSSGVMALPVTPVIILNPIRKPAIISHLGDGAKAKSR